LQGGEVAKILIADDSRAEVELFRRSLCEHGHEIIAAEDGISAEQLAIDENPDLLILDVIMPKKNGFQVCRDLKANPATSRMPIIIVTSKGEDADVFWGRRQGADEYLIKPFQVSALLEAVARLLARGD
jgi:twitching motility two-component system response regulator PilH